MLDKHILKLNDSSLTQTEHILQFLTTLEHLELIRDTIFNRINTSLAERVTKLESLKSRINRASQIVSNYSMMEKAITIKSKNYYPSADFAFQTPSQIDHNTPIKDNTINDLMNTKPKVGGEYTGKMPNETLDDMKIIQGTYEKLGRFNDLANQLGKDIKKLGMRESFEVTPIANYMTSHFAISNRKMIGPRPLLTKDSHRLNSSLFQLSESGKSNKAKPKVKLQNAPVSIEKKEQLKSYEKKRFLLGKSQGNNIEVTLPLNINRLGNIADLDIDNSIPEDNPIGTINNNGNNTLDILEDSLIEGDGLNRTDMYDFYEELPIELIQSRNANIRNQKSSNDVNAYSINNTTQGGATFTNYAGKTEGNSQKMTTSMGGSTQKVVCGNSPSIPIPPPMPVFTIVNQPPKNNKEDKLKTEEKIKSVYEEIGDNPIAKLKKIDLNQNDKDKDVNKEEGNNDNDKEVKKKEGGGSIMDLLKQQINLRYHNLRKHEEEDSEEGSEI